MTLIDTVIAGADAVVVTITPWLNGLVIALVILFTGLFVGRFLGNLARTVLEDLKADEWLRPLLKRAIPLAKAIGGFCSYALYALAIWWSLSTIGLTQVLLVVLAAVATFSLVVSVTLALRDLVPNLLAGVVVRRRKLFHAGDTLLFDGVEGAVEERGLLHTTLRRQNGDLLIVPQRLFLKHRFVRRKN